MKEITTLGNIILEVQKFCEQAIQLKELKTMQAFSGSIIKNCIEPFRKKLSKLEMETSSGKTGSLLKHNIILEEIKSISIIEFHEWLKVHIKKILHVYNFFKEMNYVHLISGFHIY